MDRELRRDVAICFCLAAATLLAYWQVGECELVNLDDWGYVSKNPHVNHGLTWESIGWAFTTGDQANWHPLTWLSHAADVQLFGVNSGAHHRVNLAIHIANVILLFLVLRWMTTAVENVENGTGTFCAEHPEGRSGKRSLSPFPGRAAMVAALFALHPLNVQSVAWVAERKNVLSMFLGLLTIAAYIWYARGERGQSGQSPWPGWWRYATVTVLLALGLMAKPMLVTLPCLFLLLDYWPLGRIRGQSSGGGGLGPGAGDRGSGDCKLQIANCKLQIEKGRKRNGEKRRSPATTHHPPPTTHLVLEKLPWLTLAAISSVVTYIVQQRGGAVVAIENVGWIDRLQNVLIAYAAYIGKMFWPVHLAVLYPFKANQNIADACGALLFLAAISAAVAWGTWRGHRYLAVGWLWYLGTLVPMIGLVQVGEHSMADRYMYLPMIGLLVLLVWLAADVLGPTRWGRMALAPAAATILVACLALTIWQVGYWKSSETLFRRALAVTSDNAPAHYCLAGDLDIRGYKQEAVHEYQQTLQINPHHPGAHNNLGFILAERGNRADARQHYDEALRLDPKFARVYDNLGNLLADEGQTAAAISRFHEALRLDPDSDKAHFNLGRVLAATGQRQEAVEQYKAALWINPEYAKAHINLANSLTVLGRTEEAIGHYREGLRLSPKEPLVWRNLAWLLATGTDARFRDGREAVRLAEQACQMTSRKNPAFLDTLAAAYAEAGDFRQAVATTQEAAALASSQGQAEAAAEIQSRKQLYERGVAYHAGS